MSLARVKVWNPGDVLTAADLNAEFNNILNNPGSLISPLTGNLDLGNFQLVRARLENVTTTQAASQIGRAMFNTSDNMVNIDDGSLMRRVPTLVSTQMLAGDLMIATTDAQPTWKLLHSSQMAGPVATAWLTFNGLNATTSGFTSSGVLQGFGINTSSGSPILSQLSTGRYQVAWSNPMSSSGYFVSGVCTNSVSTAGTASVVPETLTSSGFIFRTIVTNAGGTPSMTNPTYVSLIAYQAVTASS